MWMVVKILAWALATYLGGVLYRWGGMGFPYNTKMRDFGVPAVVLLLAWAIGIPASHWWWLWFLCMFGALTKRWKYGGENIKWYGWLTSGFTYGLSALPIAIATGKWGGFWIRTVFLMLAITIWSEWEDDVEYEERGRGWFFVGTIPLLLI